MALFVASIGKDEWLAAPRRTDRGLAANAGRRRRPPAIRFARCLDGSLHSAGDEHSAATRCNGISRVDHLARSRRPGCSWCLWSTGRVGTGGFLFDDEVHLLHNPVLHSGGLAKVWMPGGYLNYWPLTYTAYWLEYQFWGLEPLGYHLVNLAACMPHLRALLVWQVLLRLKVPGAMFAAAIFALHPEANVESTSLGFPRLERVSCR